ncbi:MAG: hypothetical protein H0T76_18660 [Nannocystis sp.]|nr:hypothetical protein [Nannocystis sp.]MBA3548509.1 hypothetical protein [Nannocystis sp.]
MLEPNPSSAPNQRAPIQLDHLDDLDHREHPGSPDPHDPLAPRPDDPRIGRWWWRASLYRRNQGSPLFLRWPVVLVLMMLLLLGLVALGFVVLVRPG